MLQLQEKDPTLLLQRAWSSQESVPAAHSFTSEQATPEPEYPTLQLQENDPSVS